MKTWYDESNEWNPHSNNITFSCFNVSCSHTFHLKRCEGFINYNNTRQNPIAWEHIQSQYIPTASSMTYDSMIYHLWLSTRTTTIHYGSGLSSTNDTTSYHLPYYYWWEYISNQILQEKSNIERIRIINMKTKMDEVDLDEWMDEWMDGWKNGWIQTE